MDLGLSVVDGVGFYLEGNGFAGEGLDEDLHTSAETKDENAFLALDLGLDIVGCVRRLHFKGAGDCLTGQGLDKNLHATKVKDTKWSVDSYWMLRRLGVAEECPLVLDPGLNVVDGVGGSTSKWFCR